MKRTACFKFYDMLQLIFAIIASVLFTIKATFYHAYLFSEWSIVNIIYCIPFAVILGCIIFGKNKNPRKLIQISLVSFLPGLIISAFDLSDFLLFNFIRTVFETAYPYIVLIFMMLLIYVIAMISSMSRTSYFSIFIFITLVVFIYSFYSFVNYNSLDITEMFSYSFLCGAWLMYYSKLNYENEYNESYIDESDEDDLDDNFCLYDVIIDLITDKFIFKGNYAEAKKSHDFYYALKNSDTDVLGKLNICGREAISNVFKFWLSCEDKFAVEMVTVEFFDICRYLSSDKVKDDEYELMFREFCSSIRNGKNCFGEIDIKLNSDSPGNVLSNLYDDKFTCFDTEFTSVESFLQGLKFKSKDKQAEIFKLSGRQAKKAGKHHNFWNLTGNLYFKGEKINRYSKEYNDILSEIYFSRYEQSDEFQKALLDSGLKTLAHSIGKKSPKQTVLTVDEYLNFLTFLRYMKFKDYY